MEVTIKELKSRLNRSRVYPLIENVGTYPEDEIDGRSEWEIVRYETDYLIDMYSEGGTWYCDDLEEAKEYLRETKNGTCFRGMLTSQQLQREKRRVEQAKECINEYKRLLNFEKWLREKGH